MATAARLVPQNIQEHYDRFAWAYRLYWGDHIHHGLFTTGNETSAEAQEQLLQHCARRAGVKPGMSVADVGCGHGGTGRFLAKEYSCNVLGLTISETQFNLARKLSRSNGFAGALQFELANAESYSFPAGAFDLIWNMESSEHFFDKAGYFRKAANALKAGGTFMVAAWTGSMQQELIRNIAEVFLCPELQTAEEYAQHIEGAGMKIVSSEHLASEVSPTWDICSRHIHAATPLLSFSATRIPGICRRHRADARRLQQRPAWLLGDRCRKGIVTFRSASASSAIARFLAMASLHCITICQILLDSRKIYSRSRGRLRSIKVFILIATQSSLLCV